MTTATAPEATPTQTVPFRKALRVFAWLSFIFEVVIIGTGGAVRLTASGLGCDQWPLCTPESLVPTPEQGLHGVIEFGNRTLTGVVLALAMAVVLYTLHAVAGRRVMMRTVWWAVGAVGVAIVISLIEILLGGGGGTFFAGGVLTVEVIAAVDALRRVQGRRDLVVLSFIVLIGVTLQAFVGGLAVLTGLNPIIVGFHYVASLLLVCVTAAYLVRMYAAPGPREAAVPRWFAILTHVTGLALAMTIVFGVLTTGSGPHSGDAEVKRHGFDATVLAHVHSWPGYILAVLVLTLAIAAFVLKLELRTWLLVLIAGIAVQVLVGVWQAREALPPVLVGIHMVLAALSAATYTVVVLHLKRPAAVISANA